MQAQQLGMRAGRLLLLFNNTLTRSNRFSSQCRDTPTSLRLQARHRPQISATLQADVTDIIAGVKLVKVKFVLQRRCEFGQQFLVVGDDEAFGAWNPEAALPMQWSEGHIWTAELEVVIGKRIEFKVIRVGHEGVLEWQPGPNRVLNTTESSSPLEVVETWSGEDGVAFYESERNDILDTHILSPESVADVGGEELPIPVVVSEAILENVETINDRTPPEQSIPETEKQTVSLQLYDPHMDTARELSVFEKDFQWAREALSMVWNKLTKE